MASQESLNRELRDACQEGNVSEITQLIQSKADPNGKDEDGWSPTHFAAFYGNVACIEVLARLGASPDTPENDGATPICIAAQNGHEACIEVLARLGASPDTPENDGATPTHFAAQNGHVACIEVLARLGASPDTPENDGYTPIYVAAFNGHVACIEVLARLGAGPDTPNKDGYTPICIAAHEGHEACIEVLARLGASPDTPENNGATPIFIAAHEGHEACIEVLARLGASPDTPANNGYTPLHIAAFKKHPAAVRTLLALGANRFLKDKDDDDALAVARSQGDVECIRLLEAARFSMATSNFLEIHGQTEDPREYPDILYSMERLVCSYGQKFAVPLDVLMGFCDVLRREAIAHRSGAAAMLENIDHLATRLWTSAESLIVGGKSVSLHGMIQFALIHDNQDMLSLAMPLIRGINMLCVTRRAQNAPPIPWQPQVYRGSSLPHEHAQFFLGAVGRKLRFRTFVACSTERQIAARFAGDNPAPDRTLWIVKFDPDDYSINVNYLEWITAVRHEHEFLFPPYSVFTIESCRLDPAKGFYIIEALAAFDNKTEPDDMEVAPWG